MWCVEQYRNEVEEQRDSDERGSGVWGTVLCWCWVVRNADAATSIRCAT